MGGILLVDDSLFMRYIYRSMLERNDFTVAGEASNGYEAIALYPEVKPDAVILDINMPGMPGNEVLVELLRSDPRAKIMMSSALGQEVFVRQCIKAGAKSFLVKPVVERVLITTLRNVLGISPVGR